MGMIDYIVLVTYFVVMVLLGLWAMWRVKDQEDYFMGGRGFGKLLQTFAAFGAGTGAHEPVTVGRTGWTSGLSGVWSALMWLFVTPVYWITAVWYRRMRHLTLGDWFVERYESRSLGAAYTIFAITFYMFYLSTMFSAIAKFAVPLIGVETMYGLELKYYLVPSIATVVILYGVLGGLTAAYWTDLIQGIFIILLSVLLIPYGLWELVKKYGDPKTQDVMDGFTIMHERVAADYFSLFAGPSSGEFPIQYIISLTLLALVGIVVQPHFIATGGGSAKSENEARIGLVVGNFLKRLCTVGWAITALIALALLAGNSEIAQDPDRVWGVAAREILGPLNIGLVGLMLACLLAAMMSSADTYMIVTSALVTRNFYAAYINNQAEEREYVFVARLTGLIIILGAAVVALTYADVFGQFKMAIELPLLFAAPFWVGMYWRRADRAAVWVTVLFSLMVFFVLPNALPMAYPELRNNPDFTTSTHTITRTTTRIATPADVARREAWEQAIAEAEQLAGEEQEIRLQALANIEPPVTVLGEEFESVTKSGGQSIFWRGGVTPAEGNADPYKVLSESDEGQTQVVVQTQNGEFHGQGGFRLDFLLYHWMGMDLSQISKATLETLRLPPRVLTPFLVLILVSFLTPCHSKAALDRYYAKMYTEVDPDPVKDQQKLEAALENPEQFESKKVLPGSYFEMMWPNTYDVVGFLVSVAVCGLIIGLLVWIAGIGS